MGSALIKEEPEEEAMPAPSAPLGPLPAAAAAAPERGADAAASEGAATGAQREAAAAAAHALVPAAAPAQQQLSLSDSLLLDIKHALLDVKEDMGACEPPWDGCSQLAGWLFPRRRAASRVPAAPGIATRSPPAAASASRAPAVPGIATRTPTAALFIMPWRADRQEADEMKDTMRAMRDEQQTLKVSAGGQRAAAERACSYGCEQASGCPHVA